jgi:dihydroorotate dehydrogenase
MGWLYRNLARPLLFAQGSEAVHDRTLGALARASRNAFARGLVAAVCDVPSLPVRVFGLEFPNPVGLAAGMDKRAVAVPMWAAMGFGHAELGGVTWHAQPGNPAPRMFRHVPDRALVNRMGFNNPGAPALAETLAAWRRDGLWPAHPVGINLGKSKATPLESAAADYADSFRALRPYGDFFVVNVSSPNTPNLRKLQDAAALGDILDAIRAVDVPAAAGGPAKPLLVKVAPDLGDEALDEVAALAVGRGLAGLVATNTTVSRPAMQDYQAQRVYGEAGGLSGGPLARRSTEVIRRLYRATRGGVPIIGVGGVFGPDDAWDKVTAGATLVQVYSGLVYEGPGVVGTIVEGLIERLGNARWNDAVGSGAR